MAKESTDRVKYWGYVVNSQGIPLENAEIRIYLADTTTEANIYTQPSGGDFTTSSQADLKTDSNGYFQLWFAEYWEKGGYSHSQKFKLEWFKAGSKPLSINNFDPWPNWEKVSENTTAGSDYNLKNKLVSNRLGKKWYDHVFEIVPSASPHDLIPVDRTLTDGKKNKVLSNKFINDILTLSNAVSAVTISGGNTIEHQQTISTWTASGGIYYKDIVHNINREVSVQLTSKGNESVVDPHLIRYLSDTTIRIFIDPPSGSYNVNVQGSSSSKSSSSSSTSSSSSSESSSSVSSSSSSVSSSSSSVSSSSESSSSVSSSSTSSSSSSASA